MPVAGSTVGVDVTPTAGVRSAQGTSVEVRLDGVSYSAQVDPDGTANGLGLLDVETTLSAEKRLEPVAGSTFDQAPFTGYEMHMGVTEGPDRARPFVRLADGVAEGVVSADGRVIGTYVHGLFANDAQRSAWLTRFAGSAATIAYEPLVEDTLDRLAAHLEAHIHVDRLLTLSR